MELPLPIGKYLITRVLNFAIEGSRFFDNVEYQLRKEILGDSGTIGTNVEEFDS